MANYNVQTSTQNTAGNDISPEIRSYYDKALIRFATPNLVHTKFGQKRNIPMGNGSEIEFRKFSPLPKALAPLAEGVTPDGNQLNVTKKTAKVKQYGDYITTSDILNLTAFDNIAAETQKVLGDQAGRTLDTVVREVINSGTNVQYGDGTKVARGTLVGGNAVWADNDYMSVSAIRAAVRTLKRNNTKTLKNGHYVGIIHPDVAFDLMKDPEWQAIRANCDPEDWYEGAIGRIAGVVFVESTEAKIFYGNPLRTLEPNQKGEADTFTITKVVGQTIYIREEITNSQALALSSKKLLIDGAIVTISGIPTPGAAGTVKLTVTGTIPATAKAETLIYPGEGAANGRPVYSTLIIGADAYGVTNVEGGGLQTIAKQAGSAGTGDPLNQRSTIGWKATQTACVLSPEFMVRIETTCSYN